MLFRSGREWISMCKQEWLGALEVCDDLCVWSLNRGYGVTMGHFWGWLTAMIIILNNITRYTLCVRHIGILHLWLEENEL